MNINILTIFPEIFDILKSGVVTKPIKEKTLNIELLDIRQNSVNKHNHVDSKPYGGGEGMVMMAEPIVKTLKQINKKNLGRVIFMSPQGKKLNQKKIISLSKLKNMTIICGRYEGIDQRIIDKYVDEEISIGDFILSGGEFAALALIDSLSRFIPGVIGNVRSVEQDSLSQGLLKGPVFTRPENFNAELVPEILLSGDHQKIEEWRENQALVRTFERRPELLQNIKLTKKQKKLLEDLASKRIL